MPCQDERPARDFLAGACEGRIYSGLAGLPGRGSAGRSRRGCDLGWGSRVISASRPRQRDLTRAEPHESSRLPQRDPKAHRRTVAWRRRGRGTTRHSRLRLIGRPDWAGRFIRSTLNAPLPPWRQLGWSKVQSRRGNEAHCGPTPRVRFPQKVRVDATVHLCIITIHSERDKHPLPFHHRSDADVRPDR